MRLWSGLLGEGWLRRMNCLCIPTDYESDACFLTLLALQFVDNPKYWDDSYIFAKTVYNKSNAPVTVGGLLKYVHVITAGSVAFAGIALGPRTDSSAYSARWLCPKRFAWGRGGWGFVDRGASICFKHDWWSGYGILEKCSTYMWPGL